MKDATDNIFFSIGNMNVEYRRASHYFSIIIIIFVCTMAVISDAERVWASDAGQLPQLGMKFQKNIIKKIYEESPQKDSEKIRQTLKRIERLVNIYEMKLNDWGLPKR